LPEREYGSSQISEFISQTSHKGPMCPKTHG
jgi:hypothetical protein